MASRSLSLLFAGGGTGGHLIPGIAMGHTARCLYPEMRIAFLVPGSPVDLAILATTPFRWHLNPMRSLPRSLDQCGEFAGRFIRGWGVTLRVFRECKPDVVVGLGGYGAFSAGVVAHYKNVPFVMIESNRVAGKVVRYLARWSKAVYSNGDVAGIPQERVRNLGVPVRDDLPLEKTIADISHRKIAILVMGGSQGAACINQAICEALPFLMDLKEQLRFIHLTGNAEGEHIAEIYRQNGFEARSSSFSSNMGKLYGEADLVVCRAGGSTLAELGAVGLPAVLIPFARAAHGHQKANACAWERERAAVVLEEKALNGRSLSAILREVIVPQRLRSMAKQARSQGRPKASLEILQDILAWVN